jgi:hypothetical protein
VILLFFILQCILLLFMALHDWIDIPPLTDLPALKRAHSLKFRLLGSCINTIFVLVPLIITFCYLTAVPPLWMRLLLVTIYGLLTFGTMTAWWIPYFGSGYWVHGNQAGFEEYRNTHSFLPAKGENVVPNTLHVILHLQIWICLLLSIYWVFG